jgi:hypothetical protein
MQEKSHGEIDLAEIGRHILKEFEIIAEEINLRSDPQDSEKHLQLHPALREPSLENPHTRVYCRAEALFSYNRDSSDGYQWLDNAKSSLTDYLQKIAAYENVRVTKYILESDGPSFVAQFSSCILSTTYYIVTISNELHTFSEPPLIQALRAVNAEAEKLCHELTLQLKDTRFILGESDISHLDDLFLGTDERILAEAYEAGMEVNTETLRAEMAELEVRALTGPLQTKVLMTLPTGTTPRTYAPEIEEFYRRLWSRCLSVEKELDICFRIDELPPMLLPTEGGSTYRIDFDITVWRRSIM